MTEVVRAARIEDLPGLEHALASAWTRGCCKVMLLSGAQRGEAPKLCESVGFVGDIERGFVARPGT